MSEGLPASQPKSQNLAKTFLLVMAGGSIVGTFASGLLLGIVPNAFLLPAWPQSCCSADKGLATQLTQ
ncbi:hypothetical protein RlegWSM1455_04070 [Rhizobium laguerreae]|uniref:Uncharacterized protein n=1 Tax=Rhizobium laguerreae TaxID=1076926 RepID=A0AAX2QQG1_9HYPH|nr:hypothetical protein [Rhizobium laguerreae]TCU27016.1 hypothetical protein EV131_10346 [Rhizobium laguerreae]UFW66951.1 hypothetical protein RlegWSM1455_04070 [Rhizobium laguerreae]